MPLAILRSAAHAVVSAVSFNPGADLADSDAQDPVRRTIGDTSTLLCVPKIKLPFKPVCICCENISVNIFIFRFCQQNESLTLITTGPEMLKSYNLKLGLGKA